MAHVNLLPTDVIERERQHARLVVWCMVSLVVACSLAIAYVVLQQRVTRVEGRVAKLKKRRADLDERIARVQKLTAEREKLQCRQLIIQGLLERHSLCFLFAELSERTPELVWLKSISVSQPEEAEPSGAKPADGAAPDAAALAPPGPRQVTLSGFARSNAELARLMSQLQGSKWIKEPVLQISKRERFLDKEATEFEIRFEF